MSHSKDDADALYEELCAALGPFDIDSFRPDPDAEPVAVARVESPDDLVISHTVTLRLPWPAFERLEARAAQAGTEASTGWCRG